MTPDQLAELETYLAAGFDFPTAMAMIQPDDDESPEPEPSLVDTAQPEKPSTWHCVVAFSVAIVSVAVSLWLFRS